MSDQQRKYQKFKWATHLDVDMNERAKDLKAFLYKKGIIERNSRYACTKYCLEWAFCEMIDNFPDYQAQIESNEATNNAKV